MKKNKRKLTILAALLAASISLSSAMNVSAMGKNPTYEELFAEQRMAVDASQVLMQYFFENGWRTEYPEYYGGCYIANNILHIRLVSPPEETMALLEDMFQPFADAIAYEFCDFSLTMAKEYTDDMVCELLELGYAVTNWHVDSQTGSAVIGVQKDDVKKVTELINTSQTYIMSEDTPEIIIEEGNYVEMQSDFVYGGTGVLIGSSACSVGVCGTYGGQTAFVSCGHGNLEEGDSAIYNSRLIGNVTKVQCAFAERGDYSVVLTNNYAKPTHKVGSSNELTVLTGGTVLSPVVGTAVRKYGRASRYGYGIVTATESNVFYSNALLISGLTTVNLSQGDSIPGDSGGPYMVGNAFCGVHSGGSNDGANIIAYFTPYSIIYEAGFVANGAHACVSWNDAGASYHSGYCNICQEIVYEEHGAYWNHALGFCRRCGRTGSVAV